MKGFSYFAVLDDGKPMAVHAHEDHAPAGGVAISKEEAIEISKARASKLTPAPIPAAADNDALLKIIAQLADQLAAVQDDIEAIKRTNVVVSVAREQS